MNEIHEVVSLSSDMATQIATAAEQQTHVKVEIAQNIASIKRCSWLACHQYSR
ncbi:hypothetical protein ACKVMY_19345 [Vibrio natriegens]|uniref:hypothetical protein n=1 Tax=Vibrio natriegens TaxID=691 RepID=UPI00390B01AB